MTVILSVEDDLDVAAVVEDILNLSGYQVITTHTAPAALDRLKDKSDIGLVLSDIRLNSHDGWWLAEQIYRLYPGLPILLTSGFAKPDENVRNWPLLRKPYRMTELVEKLRQLGIEP